MTNAFIGFFWSSAGWVGFTLALLGLAFLLAAKRRGVFRGMSLPVQFGIVLAVGFFSVLVVLLIERMTH